MNSSEENLLQSLQRGDPHACDEMIQQYSGKIYNAALRLTGHPNEAEEVLQETFINACRGVEAFEGRSSLATWLYRIATNNCLMRLRRKETPTVSLDVFETADDNTASIDLHDWQWEPESQLLNDELRRAMDESVAMLPETLRAVFVLRDLEGLSTKETAEVLGISPGSVKVRLHRARMQLRQRLIQYFSHADKSEAI